MTSPASSSRQMSTPSSGTPSSAQSPRPQQETSPEQRSDETSAGPVAPEKSLPAPGEGSDVTTLDVSGEGTTVKLGALGPLVVNQDGTMSRISNWAEMTEIERQNTLRILGKRNKLRLATLRESQAGSDDSSSNN
ncbi:3-ketoacyl-(acyl-carrier-protein) reductase [Purpureocillium lavendulum]|uniref:3-ketoacyl-(Acyl-carrier-protein) reductase n=1 Tax=Purpureocillium lavendulum TaxID=1247861 RepID=A0AB34FTA3_9HYPO|nr:3-ketoacyl-(acyl-carrier-protein) reductase [Purpureocillium lavendulum]